jgi:hypothetical protein
MPRSPDLELLVTALANVDYDVTSPVDESYNCAAWAVEDSLQWLDPSEEEPCMWPTGLPRADTSVENFKNAFELHGFSVCEDGCHDANL